MAKCLFDVGRDSDTHIHTHHLICSITYLHSSRPIAARQCVALHIECQPLVTPTCQSSVPTLQLEEDVRDECAEYGTVEGVCIPVPPRTMPPSEPGRAYIMFGSHEEATKAKPVFDGRLFDDGKVTAKLVPDDDFQRAAAGEWIHTPMPGGLPAHPGNASALASLSCRLT